MAFSQSNSRGNIIYNYYYFFFLIKTKSLLSLIAELQNRKILEELQLKKQMLLKQGVAPTLNTSLVTSTGSPSNLVNIYSYIILFKLQNRIIYIFKYFYFLAFYTTL